MYTDKTCLVIWPASIWLVTLLFPMQMSKFGRHDISIFWLTKLLVHVVGTFLKIMR